MVVLVLGKQKFRVQKPELTSEIFVLHVTPTSHSVFQKILSMPSKKLCNLAVSTEKVLLVYNTRTVKSLNCKCNVNDLEIFAKK